MEINNSLHKLVNPYQKNQVQGTDQQAVGQAAGQQPTQATPLSKGDTVNVSSQAKLMTEAYSTATANSGIRQDKVAALKEQIASGQYSVDSKNIAAKLLQSEAELGLIEG